MKMFYVYRFKDIDEQIVYVGKTNNLKTRMSQHFSDRGHLTKDQYDKVVTIEYVEFPTKIDMDIKELYYINKWKPAFNTINVAHETASLTINGRDVWKVYRSMKEDEIKKVREELRLIRIEIEKKDKLIQELSAQKSKLLEHNNSLQEEYRNFDEALQKERDFCHSRIVAFLKFCKDDGVVPSDLVYVKSKDAILLAKYFNNFSFVSKIQGRQTHVFEITQNNGIPYLRESVGEFTKETPFSNDLQSAVSETILDKFDSIAVTSGQTQEEVDEAILDAIELERITKEKTENVRRFVESGTSPIKSALGYAFHSFIGSYYSYYGDADYSRVYDLIKEKQIKTPKQLLTILDELNGHDFEVA